MVSESTRQLDNALSQHLRQIVTLPLTTLACTVPDTLACPRYLTLPYTLHIGWLGAEVLNACSPELRKFSPVLILGRVQRVLLPLHALHWVGRDLRDE